MPSLAFCSLIPLTQEVSYSCFSSPSFINYPRTGNKELSLLWGSNYTFLLLEAETLLLHFQPPCCLSRDESSQTPGQPLHHSFDPFKTSSPKALTPSCLKCSGAPVLKSIERLAIC